MYHLLARRAFLRDTAGGLGSLALASLLRAEQGRGVVAPPHVAPKVKRVIWLYMAGGPSHLETFDYKPKLAQMDGQPMPASFTSGQPIAQLQGAKLNCLGPQMKFARHGDSGQHLSELFPEMSRIADEMCILRAMKTEAINHDPAHTFMNTGSLLSGRPAMGSWVTYGLGSESSSLPGFVVMTSFAGRSPQPIATRQWHSGFLPGHHQGVFLHSKGDPVHYIRSPDGVDERKQRDVVDAVQALNRLQDQQTADPEIDTRVSQYEMAFRMQASVPGLIDLSDEPKKILELYGTQGADGSFAANCLLARRLAERGVRFIQLYHRDWDHHNDLNHYLRVCAKAVDRATMALVLDLKQRGMLDETLIVWGGEFGRTPMAQSNKGRVGRDHHMKGFSMWLAGGGVKGGLTYGATDELGYNAAEDVVHVHDLHATMLHLLGIDHKQLTFKFQGRDFRLTDVHGKVVQRILA